MEKIKLLDDNYLPFVGKMMTTVGSEYTQEDLEMVKACEHKIIGFIKDHNVVGFCVIMKPMDKYYVAYTWCEKTLTAKRVFIKGIKYLVDNYPDIQFVEEKEPVMYKAYLKIKGKSWE